MKNETVKGIIGNTQGVSKANKPPTKPNRKMLNSELPDLDAFLFPVSNKLVFFKSNFSFFVKLLLLSSKRTTSFSSSFPSKEKAKDSSICMHACLQTCP